MRLRDRVAGLSPLERQRFGAAVAQMSDAQQEALAHNWIDLLARDDQLAPPGDWTTWLILAGRGWGKTRTAAEHIRSVIDSGGATRIALVGATAADVRDTMIEGESGLLAIWPRAQRPIYEPSKRRLTFANGAVASAYSAEEPDRLRGPQHDYAWADEVCAWARLDTWDQLQFGLRLGKHPRQVVSTTPRPTKQLREMMADPRTAVTRGRTLDNASNLAGAFIATIQAKYAGTRLGRQEMDAEILDDNPGALWHRVPMLDAHRVQNLPELRRIVVAVDPAVTSNEDSDETGIVVCALGADGRGYVLEDLTCKQSPAAWARIVIDAYHKWHADRIVAEGNNGGDLIESVMRSIDANVSYTRVHARRGKFARAEPVAALYEQGRISHVGAFPQLEDELCEYDPATSTESPNRLDALVWGFTDLMLGVGFGLLDFAQAELKKQEQMRANAR